MKRICIMCIYSDDGKIENSVFYLASEMNNNVDRMIIVVNGQIDYISKCKLKENFNEIVFRSNIGFDGGAYKDILLNYLLRNEMEKYDELILMNDTFWGANLSVW